MKVGCGNIKFPVIFPVSNRKTNRKFSLPTPLFQPQLSPSFLHDYKDCPSELFHPESDLVLQDSYDGKDEGGQWRIDMADHTGR